MRTFHGLVLGAGLTVILLAPGCLEAAGPGARSDAPACGEPLPDFMRLRGRPNLVNGGLITAFREQPSLIGGGPATVTFRVENAWDGHLKVVAPVDGAAGGVAIHAWCGDLRVSEGSVQVEGLPGSAGAPERISIGPGEAFTWNATWDGTYVDENGVRRLAPEGTYLVTGYVTLSHSKDGSRAGDVAAHVPLSVAYLRAAL